MVEERGLVLNDSQAHQVRRTCSATLQTSDPVECSALSGLLKTGRSFLLWQMAFQIEGFDLGQALGVLA